MNRRNAFISIVPAIGFIALTLMPSAQVSAWQAVTNDTIGRYKSRQERARDLTADLLGALIDSHIQQLEDNRMKDHVLYKDNRVYSPLYPKNACTISEISSLSYRSSSATPD